jgi:pimeloyl-ACP methyl ester carboxylesterase
MKFSKSLLLVMMCAAIWSLGGCSDLTGRGKAPLDRTIGEATTKHPRVGHVYCMRGWLGIFSTGMDALAEKIDKEIGAPAVSVANEEWRWLREWIVDARQRGEITNEPLVLLGHSYGADDQIRVAEYLKTKGIGVDLLVLIDPVTPPAVPSNVRRVYCVYMSHPLTDWSPVWRGVPASVADPEATALTNIDLRTEKVDFDTTGINHPNIEKSEGVHNMVMEQIKMACPPRTAWLKKQRSTTPVTQLPVKVQAQ